MKKVLIALLLGSLFLFVQVYAVSAGSVVWTQTVNISCSPLGAQPPAAHYIVGDSMKWNGCSADTVRIEFPASNPWYASQIVTQEILPGGSWTSAATSQQGDFNYKIVLYKNAARFDSIQVSMNWVNPVPSLSTWAVLVLVLGLIAVSIALLRKRIRVGA